MTRARYIDQGTTAGGGGPGGGGDIVFLGPEYGEPVDLTVGAAVAFKDLNLGPFSSPQVGVAETFRLLQLGPFNTPQVGARVSWPSMGLGPFAAPKVGMTVSGRLTANGLAPAADTYLDRSNPNTAFGSATGLLAKQNTPIVDDNKNAYIAWDFTGLTGFTSVNTATLRLTGQHSDLVGTQTPAYEVYTMASQPFVEATATWNQHEPWAAGTLRQQGNLPALGTSATSVSFSLDSAVRSNLQGNWVLLRVHATNVASTVTITVFSKEHATTGNRPTLDLALTL